MLARASTDRLASLDFKGNKQSLPFKPCAACGRSMNWRKRWSKTWSEVKFCSEACRKIRIAPTSVRV